MPRCTLHESDAVYFRALAQLAREESDDPNTQNAAGLKSKGLHHRGFSAMVANELPWTIDATPERTASPAKYDWIMHAEAGVLVGAGDRAISGTLYALWAACPSCALTIVAAGVARVVTLQATQDATPERWRAKVATGMEILRAGGVEVEFFTGRLDETIRFDGKELRL